MATEYESDFLEAWAIYPRKVAKAAAQKAWKATGADRPPLPHLLAAVRALTDASAGKESRFVPHMSTWLRGQRWNDAPDPPRASPGASWTAPVASVDRQATKVRAIASRRYQAAGISPPVDLASMAPADVFERFRADVGHELIDW